MLVHDHLTKLRHVSSAWFLEGTQWAVLRTTEGQYTFATATPLEFNLGTAPNLDLAKAYILELHKLRYIDLDCNVLIEDPELMILFPGLSFDITFDVEEIPVQ